MTLGCCYHPTSMLMADKQGYTLPEKLITKELSIKVGNQDGNFLFKPPYSYTRFSMKERCTVIIILITARYRSVTI